MATASRVLDQMHSLHFELVHHRRIDNLAEAFGKVLPERARVLDVGSGDGLLACEIMRRRADVSITGVDILPRREAFIPVQLFDGETLPFEPSSFDTVMFSDVLHHATNQRRLLMEARRVARGHVIVKDHLNESRRDEWRLRAMDYVGNRHNGVPLPYDYWPEQRWRDEFRRASLVIDTFDAQVQVYPRPLGALIGRRLHVLIRGAVEAG